MENSSKAFIMAGGILIAILVVSLLVFAFSRIKSYQNQLDTSKKIEQVTEFNKQFESYNKSVVTGYELISLANLARDHNTRYTTDEGFKEIKIYIKLKNSHGTLPGGYSKKSTKKSGYFDLVDYVETVYSNLDDNNREKEFKELYFQSEGVINDEVSGRVVEMSFTQLTQK